MANAITEQIKEKILEQVTSERDVSLMELWQKSGAELEWFSGALQSLVQKGDLVVNSSPGGQPEQIRFGRQQNGGAAPGGQGQDRSRAIKVLHLGVFKLKKLVQNQWEDELRDILGDGVPRTREQLARLTSVPDRVFRTMRDLVVLPGGDYTLKDTPAGRLELERRAQAARRNREVAQRQRLRIDELIKRQGAITKQEIEADLGEELVPESVSHLVRLPGDRYTLPDSNAAWEEVARYLAHSEPMARKEFARLFKRHKKLVALVRKGREEPPFVLLPDGRVTVETRLEGREELRRREILAYVHYTLKERMGGRSFFTLEDFAPRERTLARQEALHAGCVELKTGRREIYYCAPIKARRERLAGELKEITGLDFPAGSGLSQPVTYLLDVSLTPREAARKLGLHTREVANLYEQDYLQGFLLEDSLRYWRPAVEAMRNSPHLQRVLRRIEKIRISEAARILGLTPQEIRRAIREGYLPSAGRDKKHGDHRLRRGDVEELLTRLAEIKAAWGETAQQAGEVPFRRKKRRPRNRRPAPVRTSGPLVLDEYQKKSIAALEEGHCVLVAAPTGTGKTLIAERLVQRILEQNQEVIYTSPLKALSNQKYRDFARLYGYDRVGLITGDISINERAQLLVMTTEIFRNWCFANPQWMTDITHIIFDEIHYLDDPERGTAWEESIIFAPPHIRVLGLSATVPNIHELAAWMEEVRGVRVVVVEEYRRAVPLKISWISPDNTVLDEQEARDEIEVLISTARQSGHRRQQMQ